MKKIITCPLVAVICISIMGMEIAGLVLEINHGKLSFQSIEHPFVLESCQTVEQLATQVINSQIMTASSNQTKSDGYNADSGKADNGTQNIKPPAETKPAQPAEDKTKEKREFITVDNSYFEDAVFIGDSRMVGLHDYSGFPSTFYATTGMTVYDLLTEAFITVDDDREKITLEEALRENQFGKIYLMVGINELGTGTEEEFIDKYREVVNMIRIIQPDAILFLQAIQYVTGERSDTDQYINNANIRQRNDDILALADGENIFYFDANEVLSDEEGNLIAQYSYDNAHLKAAYYPIWVDFIKAHGIEPIHSNT